MGAGRGTGKGGGGKPQEEKQHLSWQWLGVVSQRWGWGTLLCLLHLPWEILEGRDMAPSPSWPLLTCLH